MDTTIAAYLDFVAFAYPDRVVRDRVAMAYPLQTDAQSTDSTDSTGQDELNSYLSVGVEKAVRLGFRNSYFKRDLILTEHQLEELLDFVDSGALQAEYPEVDQVAAKETLEWLMAVLKTHQQ